MSPRQRSHIEQKMSEKLHRVRVKDENVQIAAGVLLFAAASVGIFVTAIILEAIFYLSVPFRTALLFGAGFIVLISFILFIFYPAGIRLGIFRRKGEFDLAKITGSYFPSIKDRLLNLLQIAEEEKTQGRYYSADLIDASFYDLAEEVEGKDFTESISYRKPKQIGRSLLYGIVFIGILLSVSPTAMYDAIYRIVHYQTEFIQPQPFVLYIEPGDIEAVRGDTITINVKVDGELQEDVSLNLRQDGQIDFEEILLSSSGRAEYSHKISNIRRSTEYYAHSGDQQSTQHKITVLDRPTVQDLRVSLVYPDYTGLPTRYLDDNSGNITALRGTQAGIEVTASKDLASASVAFRNGESLSMDVSANTAFVKFTLTDDDRYKIILRDNDGVENRDPIEYSIRVIEDEYPSVAIIKPGENINIDESLLLPMIIRIQDDYGFTRLQLGYRLVQSRYESPHQTYTYKDVPLPSTQSTDLLVEYLWSLRDLRLAPEDVISYHVVVYDNDVISGPKKSVSDSYLLRLPSLEEVFAELDERQTRSIRDFEYSSEEAEKLRRELEDIRRELQLAQHELTWERQQRMEDILQKYEELQKQIEQTTEHLDKTIEEMQRHQVLSGETLEKYLELQDLYRQLNDPELQAAMDKLREAMERMDPNMLREAMQNMTFNEEQFRQTLERTINLLKRVQIEQKVDELIKRSEQMVEEQRELEGELSQSETLPPELIQDYEQRLEELRQQLERMMEELAELQKRMEEFPTEMPLDELQKTMDELTDADIENQIEQLMNQMQMGDVQNARQTQSGMQSSLDQLHSNLQQMQQSLLEGQMQHIVNEMRRSLRNINELSKRQEQLRDETRSLEPNSQLFQDGARQQHEAMLDLNTVVEELISLSQKTFAITPDMGRAIGQAFQNMREALERLESRSGTLAAQSQDAAMASLNEASLSLQIALQAMMQGGGGAGMQAFIQQLQNMAGRQQQLNIDTHQLGDGQMTMEQMAEMARIAGEQEALRRSLEELAKEMAQVSDRHRILGDLDRIEQEMREVVRDLQASDIQPETLRRQERILSRLLDAQRSIRERDYEERRESRPGEQFVRESPPEIDLSTQEGRNRLREDLLRAVREGYSRDYELLIRRYFELLQEREE